MVAVQTPAGECTIGDRVWEVVPTAPSTPRASCYAFTRARITFLMSVIESFSSLSRAQSRALTRLS